MSAAPETTGAKPRTAITRIPEKGSTDRDALNRLLDTVHIGHFALVAPGGYPVVLPTAVVRDGDRILVHGSTGSGWMRQLADGAQASLAVTAFDGLVVARSAFESSMHYRSAVLFGRCTTIRDPAQKDAALDLITDALIPGRVVELRRPTAKELAATLVLALPIDEWSLKVSDGWPDDPDIDVAGPAWAGVIAARISYGPAVPAPDLHPGIEQPDSVRRLIDN
jgi:nitroimidazol reductase NimA-like FMN-containing flavoprotein (pyridoxamine 5'-phosphate oxidase superfamily)